MKKTLAVLTAVGAMSLFASSPAVATYPAPQPSVSVSASTVAQGEAFIFSGQGMLPNEPVTVTVTLVQSAAAQAGSRSAGFVIKLPMEPQALKTAAKADGSFSLPIVIDKEGTYSVLAIGDISGHRVGPVVVTVTPLRSGVTADSSVADAGTNLANTGFDSGVIFWSLIGAGAVSAGLVSLTVIRRKTRSNNID